MAGGAFDEVSTKELGEQLRSVLHDVLGD
jgi:hypothetical protein